MASEPFNSDPLGLAEDAPLLAGWLRYTADVAAGRLHPFTTPGHKQRHNLVGAVLAGDVPLFGGPAPIKRATDVLAIAEHRAADLWGVDYCRFSVGGSTHGNQALALAVGTPGREVVVSRTLHRSMLIGLVLAGLRPVWVRPEVDAATGLPTAVPVATVAAALKQHPDACAVLLGEPSYVGTIGDVAGHADVAHAAGVPLVVDAAWAPHFGFHPDLPAHALALGADAMVISAHKALPSVTQSAIVLARTTRAGGLLDVDRLERAFEAGNTTSPSGTMLASIDAARALLAKHGEPLCDGLLTLVGHARRRLAAVPGLAVLERVDGAAVDPSKLVVLLAGTGAHGHAVEDDLIAAGLPVEMADRDTIVALVTMSDDDTSVNRLVDALIGSVERRRGTPRPVASSSAWTVDPVTVLPPREAFFAPHEAVGADDAVGRVSAELVAPYPPGIPVLAPGELITAETVAALHAAHADGVRIAYAADPTLRTLQVVR